MNLLLLHAFVDAAGGDLTGATLGAPTWYRPVLVIPFTPPGRRSAARYLVAVLEPPGPFAFVTGERPLEGARAPERFGALSGRRVTRVHQAGRDRVIRIDVEAARSDAPGAFSLLLHLYGARGSAVLTRESAVLETVGARRRDDWRPSEKRSLVDIDAATLETVLSLTETDGAHSPRALVPGADRPLLDAFAQGDGAVDAAALVAFRDAFVAGRTPFCLAASTREGDAVPVPPGACAGAAGPFESVAPACEALGQSVLGAAKHQIVAGLLQPIRHKLSANEKLLQNLHADLDAAAGHDALRREAETLAAYQSTIRPGAAAAELPDLHREGATVHIELDPAIPIRTQIEKRFKRAGKLEKSETHTRRRIELVEREMMELRSAIKLLEGETSLATALLQLDVLRSRYGIDASRPASRRRRTDPSTTTAGRRFDLGGGWYALVGRNNHDNDRVTFHEAAPGDLWFHAQSVPGSHVVLKTSRPSGSPPAAVIERAAALAAHHSKSRHSGLVPVIYTQRKYVRKFRGARPGQVVCEREKMVMVAPSLPDEAEPA